MSNVRVAIILAAGKGTRMLSKKPKVLHKVGNYPVLGHVIDACAKAVMDHIVVVTSPHLPEVKQWVNGQYPKVIIAEQPEALGTADALKCGLSALPSNLHGTVITLCGDAPLIKPEYITESLDSVSESRKMVILAMQAINPFGYGRLITEQNRVTKIVEEKEATDAEKRINLCNSGVIAADLEFITQLLPLIKNNNSKGEFYLTDAIEIAAQQGNAAGFISGEEEYLAGFNDRQQLSQIEATFQRGKRAQMMLAGATLEQPESVFFSYDTQIAADVEIAPNVYFGPGVDIGTGVSIKPFCHIEGTKIAENCIIGPFARLRPGTVIGSEVHIGNFVEIKKSTLGNSTKANHLSYIGDAVVGTGVNIGAGTITCNYDGFNKMQTVIEDGAFIGSNTSLVAPVKIGSGAITGAGSVITEDVAADALALTRSEQQNKPGWAAVKRRKASRSSAA